MSLIITCSAKGEEYVRKIQKKFSITLLDYDKATYNLKSKDPYSEAFMNDRMDFIEKCSTDGFAVASKGIKLKNAKKAKVKF